MTTLRRTAPPVSSWESNGPQLIVYTITQSTGLPAPNSSLNRIPSAATVTDTTDSWALESPGVPWEYNEGLYPVDGSRFGVWHDSSLGSTKGFRFTEPGVYTFSLNVTPTLSATAASDSILTLGAQLDGHSLYFMNQTGAVQSSSDHFHPDPIGGLGGKVISGRIPITADYLGECATVSPVTWPGFTPVVGYRRPTGTVTVTAIAWEIVVMRWLPDDHVSTWHAFASDW